MTMLPRTRATLLAALACAAISTSARAAEPAKKAPLTGDAVNGGRLYRLHCQACHGVAGEGDGPLAGGLDPRPAHVRDGSLVWARSDESLIATILGASAPKNAPPMHGRGLTELDARDVLAWLRAPVPSVRDFFAFSTDYIAHKHAIDQFGLERAEKSLGAPLAERDRTVMIFTAFKAADVPAGEQPPPLPPAARLIPEEPAALYAAKPKRKIGFIGYVPLDLDGGTIQVALAFNRMMRLFDVRTIPSGDVKTEALRRKLDPIIEAYEGSGGREEKNPVEPHKKGLKAPPDLQREMLRAYTRVLEGAAMYEKEERDRFWADPDAFKYAEAADMEDVKFEFKEKKKK